MKKLINSKFYILDSKSAFTLIELLVVTTIILLLSGLGVVAFTGAQKKARDNKRKADLEQVRAALEMYRDDEDVYPTGGLSDAEAALTGGNYLDSMPTDPKGYSYYYSSTNGYTYTLCAYLESGGTDDCGNNCSAPDSASCNYEVNNP